MVKKGQLTISTPGGGGGGGLLEPAPTLKIRNFQTFRAMTIKFGEFSPKIYLGTFPH